MNKTLFPETWARNAPVAIELGKFCGRVAKAQYADGRDWLNEQPAGSDLYKYDPWPEVLRHERTKSVIFDQCQLGAKDERTGQTIKKPTELVCSDADLIYYLEGLR